MDDFVHRLVENLKGIFGDNLFCILLLGSVQKGDTTPFSDIDLVAIIKEFDLGKIKDVRQLLRQSEVLVDLSFICWDEIPKDPNLFTIGTHGCYQLGLILNKAKCLFGRNMLLDLGKPSEENIRQSLVQKIIQYTWWARRMFVESNRERSLESNYQINSRLIKMIRGLLYLADRFDIHSRAEKAVNRFIEKYSDMLSEEEISVATGLIEKSSIGRNSANMSEEYFSLRISVINKIHKETTKLFYTL
ncbi:nucleotidyltransferase domain-containing protein [Patescibacteria group bacterium]|nr:nucleotidyltransferase domain-containing protein [Patescibacteria group bacterium]